MALRGILTFAVLLALFATPSACRCKRRRSFVPNPCLLALPQLCMAATWSVAIILLSLRVVIDLLLPAVSFVDPQHWMCSSLPSATMTPAAPASLLSES